MSANIIFFQRYIYPLVAPPTPDRLEQDKKHIDEQFEKAFALVEQLAKDTDLLKAAEQARTTKLDATISDLETVMSDLKAANRRRDDEAQRVRDDVQSLKDSIPRAMNNQKDLTDNRLREVNAELKSLKTLITQRMNPASASTSTSSYMRPGLGGVGTTSSPAVTPAAESNKGETKDEPKTTTYQDFSSSNNRTSSPFGSGMQSKASIPAWQMMASNKSASTSTPAAASTSNASAVNSSNDAGSSGTDAAASA